MGFVNLFFVYSKMINVLQYVGKGDREEGRKYRNILCFVMIMDF